MSSLHLQKFTDTTPVAEEYYLPPEKLISGNPKQTLWSHYTDPSSQFFTGIWHSEPGKWHVYYTEEEYCRILEGRSIITDTDGRPVTVEAGEDFVIPKGFVGTWEVVEATRKTYVIWQAPM
jgi:uncharacterized protein